MTVNSSNIEQVIISELKISEDEAKVYIAIVKKGKWTQPRFQVHLAGTMSTARSSKIAGQQRHGH